jgi:hypothetical protein
MGVLSRSKRSQNRFFVSAARIALPRSGHSGRGKSSSCPTVPWTRCFFAFLEQTSGQNENSAGIGLMPAEGTVSRSHRDFCPHTLSTKRTVRSEPLGTNSACRGRRVQDMRLVTALSSPPQEVLRNVNICRGARCQRGIEPEAGSFGHVSTLSDSYPPGQPRE